MVFTLPSFNTQQLQRLLLGAMVGLLMGLSPNLWGQSPGDTLPSSPTLLDRSPFLPPGWTPPEVRRQRKQPNTAVNGYEFRGMYKIGDEYRFLVSEPRSRSGSWVRVGESRDNFEVRRYDASSDTLVLFFNNKEQPIQMAEMESNPTPIPVSGQVQSPTRETKPKTTKPVRRTIRPASRTTPTPTNSTPPPPAWLQKLREEAAERRAQNGSGNVLPPSNVSASSLPPPPDGVPPTPPPDLSAIDIPPPPDTLPPAPPVEIQEQILDSINRRSRPGN